MIVNNDTAKELSGSDVFQKEPEISAENQKGRRNMAIEVFNRVEKKYIIDDYSYHILSETLSSYMIEDRFCTGNRFYSISNIYFDTWDDELIRRSVDRPLYKEKLRLRSYGIPTLEDKVFLEIKKKFKGVVNKRRTVLQLGEAYDFLLDHKSPMPNSYINEQVLNELKYFMDLYQPVPKVYLAYDRKALFGKEDGELRITFDTNIRTRRERLRLESGDDGEELLKKGIWLMEIKTVGSMPVWLSELLTELKIYGCSFSKYGTEYKNYIAAKRSRTERKIC